MLSSFRKASQTWVAKIFFGVLGITFVGWGIGDVIRMRADTKPAISVGDVKISAAQVADDFRQDADRMRQQFGGKITADQLRQMGFMEQTIQRLVSQALLDQEGKRLGLAVDDQTLRNVIGAIGAFKDDKGNFDTQRYHDILRSNGFTEQRFEESERVDIVRARLTDTVALGTVAPDPLVDPIYRYRHEQRIAELIAYAASAMPKPAAPDDATLQAYHKEHSAQFMAPERRALSFIVVKSSDLVADYKPTDDQLAKAYQDRQGDFTSEETRHLQQVFFSDKDSAQKLYDAVKGGASMADAAKAAGKSVDDLGEVTRKSLPIDQVAVATFAANVPGVVGPVQTPLGWNVFYIVDKQPAKVKPLAEVKDQLVAALTKEEASQRLNALSTKIEDTLGSGAGLEEVATTANTKLIKVKDVVATGLGLDGKPVADLPKSQSFLPTAFKTAKGEISELAPLDQDETSYFLVRVDDVTPPALKPFDVAKNDVLAAWTLDRQKEEAQKAANDAVDRLNKGDKVNAVAGSIKPETTEPFVRTGSDKVPSPVAAAAFKLEAGKAVAVPVDATVYAVKLDSILRADPKADAPGVEDVRDQVQQMIGADLNSQFVIALDKQIGVTINRQQIDQQFSSGQ
ncbi:MAG TPA: SurA N-terminal domain-containing protein [Magnetospirillaceae bacterium]